MLQHIIVAVESTATARLEATKPGDFGFLVNKAMPAYILRVTRGVNAVPMITFVKAVLF